MFYILWLESEAHRCGKRPLLSATGAHPCPRGAVASCHLWWRLWAYIWRWNSIHAINTFTCLSKENRCMLASCMGTHCLVSHVTRQAGAGVLLAGRTPTRSWKDMGQWLQCANWLLFCVASQAHEVENMPDALLLQVERNAGNSQEVWDQRQEYLWGKKLPTLESPHFRKPLRFNEAPSVHPSHM